MATVPLTALSAEEFAVVLTDSLTSGTVREVAITAAAYLGYLATLSSTNEDTAAASSDVAALLTELTKDQMLGVPMTELYTNEEGAYQAYIVTGNDTVVLTLPAELVPQIEYAVVLDDGVEDEDEGDCAEEDEEPETQASWQFTDNNSGESLRVEDDRYAEMMDYIRIEGTGNWTITRN